MLFYISLSVFEINLLFKYLLTIIYLIDYLVILRIYIIRSLVGGSNSLKQSKV